MQTVQIDKVDTIMALYRSSVEFVIKCVGSPMNCLLTFYRNRPVESTRQVIQHLCLLVCSLPRFIRNV